MAELVVRPFNRRLKCLDYEKRLIEQHPLGYEHPGEPPESYEAFA
jgi:hypothetical protein